MVLQNLDDNALEILNNVKARLKNSGIDDVSYSDAVRELKKQLDEANIQVKGQKIKTMEDE